MSKIIASTYEIIEQIGAGGGGTVYLANHLRLGKKVVLKADKRKITTRPEILRREVDILKELNHSYIPQVYDFFVEDEVVYTVMGYIEGESLDRPLKRGEKFPQAQVVKWAKQLLEALSYLHNPVHGTPPRGFVHSDIKPANLMRTPYNDICLIDFNIALALGEENVVGRSAGYASPEHYGLDYSMVSGTATVQKTESLSVTEGTVTIDDSSETLTLAELHSKTSFKKVVPDVRSDIYSVGATLYHLLSGQRPASDFLNVVPLSPKEFSPSVIRIITKAMNPNPDFRYQSAEEMLMDLRHLHANDPRTKRLKRSKKIMYSVAGAAFCIGVATAFVGLKRIQTVDNWLKLAEYSKNALEEGNSAKAVQLALEANPGKTGIFTPEPLAQTKYALAEALGVYDLSDGFKKDSVVTLPKNPLFLSLSPDGSKAACIYDGGMAVVDTAKAEIIADLPAETSALSEVEFLTDEIIVYAGDNGVCAYDISARKELWTGNPATGITVSGDGKTVATVYKDETQAFLYDGITGEVKRHIDFGGRKQTVSMATDIFANANQNLFELNESGSALAVSFDDGSLSVFHHENSDKDFDILDQTSGYIHFEGGFHHDYLAFAASQVEKSMFVVVDVEKKVQTFGFVSKDRLSGAADADGIYIQSNNILVKIDPLTGEQTPMVATDRFIRKYDVFSENTVICSDEEIMFYSDKAIMISSMEESSVGLIQMSGSIAICGRIDAPELKIMKYEEHTDRTIASYDSSYEHDEVRLSADGTNIMLFSYRGFRICDLDGQIIADIKLPNAQQVYDQQYIRKGKDSYLEVTYKDGAVCTYNGKDGMVVSEVKKDAPDMTAYEEFYTDKYIIKAPLQGVPQVYDLESDKLVCELKEDGLLTYVNQVGDYIVIQYVDSEGFCYGRLLNQQCETLADLPYLTDVIDGELYFDYPSGIVRKVKIYDNRELISLAGNLVQ